MRAGRNNSRANGKAKAAGKVKHKREPAKLVPLPTKNTTGKQRLLDSQTDDNDGSQQEEEEHQVMAAEQMVGDGSDTSDDERQGAAAAASSKSQNGRTVNRNVDFLTSLDVNAIST